MNDVDNGQTVLFGATSSIGRALAAELASNKTPLLLVGRDRTELERLQAHLSIQFRIPVKSFLCDLSNEKSTVSITSTLLEENPSIEALYFLAGYLGDPARAAQDPGELSRILQINFSSAVVVLSMFASYFQKKEKGTMVIFGSVAGDRGRASNYVYGAAKAGLHAFAQGLRGRLFPYNVHVVTVKPGFVDTAMTWGKPGVFLAASPEKVARTVVKKVKQKKDIIYVPWFWRYIMLILLHIPEGFFKRIKF